MVTLAATCLELLVGFIFGTFAESSDSEESALLQGCWFCTAGSAHCISAVALEVCLYKAAVTWLPSHGCRHMAAVTWLPSHGCSVQASHNLIVWQ